MSERPLVVNHSKLVKLPSAFSCTVSPAKTCISSPRDTVGWGCVKI